MNREYVAWDSPTLQRRMELLRQRVGACLGGWYPLDVRNLLAAG